MGTRQGLWVTCDRLLNYTGSEFITELFGNPLKKDANDREGGATILHGISIKVC